MYFLGISAFAAEIGVEFIYLAIYLLDVDVAGTLFWRVVGVAAYFFVSVDCDVVVIIGAL